MVFGFVGSAAAAVVDVVVVVGHSCVLLDGSFDFFEYVMQIIKAIIVRVDVVVFGVVVGNWCGVNVKVCVIYPSIAQNLVIVIGALGSEFLRRALRNCARDELIVVIVIIIVSCQPLIG